MVNNPTPAVEVTRADEARRLIEKLAAADIDVSGTAAIGITSADIIAANDWLSSTPSRGGEVEKLIAPFADYHGDLPDYDHPLRPTYESGIQYAVDLLAKELGVEDYVPCDGTEDFDGDLGGTLMNIVLEAMPKDADGDPIHPRDLAAALASPPPAEGLTSGVDQVWERREELDNWRRHVREAREHDDPNHPHHAAEHAFNLACSLSKYVATPWAINLTPADVTTLTGMILDREVEA